MVSSSDGRPPYRRKNWAVIQGRNIKIATTGGDEDDGFECERGEDQPEREHGAEIGDEAGGEDDFAVVIQKKVEGQEISVTEAPPEGKGKVIDLVEALRASLEKTEKARVTVSKIGERKAPKRVEEAAKTARKSTRR